jgi:Fusaric acid resistance protein-like
MDDDIVDSGQFRRGALFLVGIGIPVIVGLLRRQPDAVLIGAVVGLLLAFADNDGELPGRLRLLVFDAAMIAGGGIVGYLCRDSVPALWAVFIAITLSVGMAARSGREALLTGRHCAMAFTVTSALPAFPTYLIWYLVGVLVLTAAARVIDHMLAGPLPLQPSVPLQMPAGQSGWLRFALAFCGAAVASMWIGRTLDPIHAIWVVTTALVVMLPDERASYRRIFERVAGTFAGVVAAWIITMLFHSAVIICIAILVIAPLIPHHVAHRYWLHTALIALLVLLAYDLTLLNSHGIGNLLSERLEDILLGCAMGLVGTVAGFPREAAAGFDDLIGDGRKDR